MPDDLLCLSAAGLYCPAGDFHIDPWHPVDRAVVTHAHSDHARPGSGSYLAAADGVTLLQRRLGAAARIRGVAWGERVRLNGVSVSLHPAGHVLGSAQVRVEHGGRVWVAAGDYKLAPDPTCTPFEPVSCHTFITESTFALPVYRWPAPDVVLEEINAWWRGNAAAGRASVLMAYALGKAQRLIAGVDPSIGPILTHGAVEPLNALYRQAGVPLPPTTTATGAKTAARDGALIVAPPSAGGSSWLRRFDPLSTAFASGWMTIRGTRRRRGVERGFVLSDHADWEGLLTAIRATGAESVWATHGYTAPLVRRLRELSLDARAIETRFSASGEDADEEAAEA